MCEQLGKIAVESINLPNIGLFGSRQEQIFLPSSPETLDFSGNHVYNPYFMQSSVRFVCAPAPRRAGGMIICSVTPSPLYASENL